MEFDDERIEVNREKLTSMLRHLYTYSECYNLYNWVHGRLCDAKRQHEKHCYTNECPFCEWTTLMNWLQDGLNEDPDQVNVEDAVRQKEDDSLSKRR